jgi:HPt (histidine-containing phosphotransfer) domain-containing protein
MAQLLTLAGPGLADALLAQFHADLSSVCARMTGALAAGDRVQLASALHVLLALADTAGAHPLAQDARTLHTKADIMPQITLAQSGAVVLDGLARLIEQINRIAADRLTCA